MKSIYSIILLALLCSTTSVFAQEDNKLEPTTEELIILFSVAVLIVVGIVIYMLREIIGRKKTDYDEKELESKKDRSYEKYHSDWTDDYYEFGKKRSKTFDDEFRKELEENTLPDLYKILGVTKDATQDQIKQKYRKLAKEHHPDKTKTPETKEKMAEINKAYEILSDESKKKQYDASFEA